MTNCDYYGNLIPTGMYLFVELIVTYLTNIILNIIYFL